MAIIANTIHLEAILGAFAAGLVLDETDLRKELDRLVMPVADLLVPIFFVTVGAKADLGVLNPFVEANCAGLVIATFLVVVTIVGKVITGWAVFGKPGINHLTVSFGMIPCGEVGLVFASIGSASGVLDKPLEAAIIVMVIVTTFIAPPLLQMVLDKPSDGDLDDQKAELEKTLSLQLGVHDHRGEGGRAIWIVDQLQDWHRRLVHAQRSQSAPPPRRLCQGLASPPPPRHLIHSDER